MINFLLFSVFFFIFIDLSRSFLDEAGFKFLFYVLIFILLFALIAKTLKGGVDYLKTGKMNQSPHPPIIEKQTATENKELKAIKNRKLKIIILLITTVAWLGKIGYESYDLSTLGQTTDELASFLKEKKMTGAVVQKLIKSNSVSTWLITSDGEKEKLYQIYDLGHVCDMGCGNYYTSTLFSAEGYQIAISPDKTYLIAFNDNPNNIDPRNPRKAYSYKLGTHQNTFWNKIKETNRLTSLYAYFRNDSCDGSAFSPDGTMFIRAEHKSIAVLEVNPQITLNDEIEPYLKLISHINSDNVCDIVWASDSTYAIMNSDNKFLHYDVKENTIKEIGTVSRQDVKHILEIISPNEMMVYKTDGTYLLRFEEPKNIIMKKMLPQNIKLIGIIP